MRHADLVALSCRHSPADHGMAFFGSPDLRDAVQTASALTIDPERTPVVLADIDTGRLHVFYCAAGMCTQQEMLRDSLQECNEALETTLCLPYAIRAEDRLICVMDVGLNHRRGL